MITRKITVNLFIHAIHNAVLWRSGLYQKKNLNFKPPYL